MKSAGIDVTSKTVTPVIDQAGRTGKPRECRNTPEEHVDLSKVLGPGQPRRPGGHRPLYHLDLAVALDGAGLDVMVINPKAAQRFAEAMQTCTKTDAVDAALLAQLVQRLPFEPWQRHDAPALAICAGARHIAALNKLLTQTKNQLHAAQLTAMTPGFVIASLQQIDRLPRSPDRAPAPPGPQHHRGRRPTPAHLRPPGQRHRHRRSQCHSAPRRIPGLA